MGGDETSSKAPCWASRLVPRSPPHVQNCGLCPKTPGGPSACPSLPHPCSLPPPVPRAPWPTAPSHSVLVLRPMDLSHRNSTPSEPSAWGLVGSSLQPSTRNPSLVLGLPPHLLPGHLPQRFAPLLPSLFPCRWTCPHRTVPALPVQPAGTLGKPGPHRARATKDSLRPLEYHMLLTFLMNHLKISWRHKDLFVPKSFIKNVPHITSIPSHYCTQDLSTHLMALFSVHVTFRCP